MEKLTIEKRGDLFVGQFRAMASPCQIQIELSSRTDAQELLNSAMREARRIEKKFSRYVKHNIVWRINNSRGNAVRVDKETARLLDFSSQCFELSDGLFDITSGVLRKVWTFDGSERIPDPAKIEALLSHIGWEKLSWEYPCLSLPPGMQLDFGGIGKEYAVDRTASVLSKLTSAPFLVNYGGDLHASAPPRSSGSWKVGIESVSQGQISIGTVHLYKGALTTSGDAQRFLMKNGVRYGHVLNPRTGWPCTDSPSSITVAGSQCVEAGILSTLAMLKGACAETFLQEQQVTYWCQR